VRAKLLLATALAVTAGRADVLVDVRPSSGPNAYGSPSYSAWVANVMFALQNDLDAVGDPDTDPAAYSVAARLGVRDNIASSSGDAATEFPSWRGMANPGAVFGPAFANEYGNILFFGLRVIGDGEAFRLSNLAFSIVGTDYDNALGFDGDFSDPSDVYTPRCIGVYYGEDRIPGTADDVVRVSGEATLLVDELYYRGVGTSSLAGVDPYPGAGQAPLNGVAEYYTYYAPLTVTMTYTLNDDAGLALGAGSASVVFDTPEPGATGLALLGAALIAIARFTLRGHGRA
jgi:hypothetical protein